MNILVINSGSSSIKYQLIEMPSKKVKAGGLIERIGFDNARITYKKGDTTISEELAIENHEQGLSAMNHFLLDNQSGVISDKNDIYAVGHRVVHGGKDFSDTVEINPEVKEKIKSLSVLAPLHNPNNLTGIEVSEKIFPEARQIAVFDTAFFQDMPEKAFRYAIPSSFYDDHDIRAYGFHGTSHKYVSELAELYLKNKGLPFQKLITIHLGNGCSMTAIKDGVAVDHSLGFGPSNGLIMGTRSGDIDQSVIFYLIHQLGYSSDEVNRIIQKESGMLGLTGYQDLRDIQENAASGNKVCQLALDMNSYRIKKYIGAYAAALNGLNAVVFTAGIGENSSLIRQMICENMEFFNIQIDDEKNKSPIKQIFDISLDSAKTKVLVIPTNEELEIAVQSFRLLKS
jgi:acetate kinase